MGEQSNHHFEYYKAQIKTGQIQKAYKALMEYIMSLRTHFMNEYPDEYIVGGLHPGYMDITYFQFTPKSLKKYRLKIVIIFNHEKLRFEAWLVGQNRQVQKKYWEIFKGSDWNKYRIPETLSEGFSIVDTVLIEDPSFLDLKDLTAQIESKAISFIKDIENVLER